MTANELVRRCVDIAKNYPTLYVSGCFGAPLTGKNVDRYCKNNAYNQAQSRQDMIRAVADRDPPVYGFDCVCLIKGILWGWTGDPAKTYGGAAYGSNGVPDIGEDAMIRSCSLVEENFQGIIPGAVVWMPGHIGVYIGDGLAVECSPKWANGVQITAVGNIGNKTGYNSRLWKKWGLLPYVDYTKQEDKTVTYEQWKEYMERYRKELGELPVPKWAQTESEMARAAGLTDGTRPCDFATRQEAASLALRALKAAQK